LNHCHQTVAGHRPRSLEPPQLAETAGRHEVGGRWVPGPVCWQVGRTGWLQAGESIRRWNWSSKCGAEWT